MNPVGSGPLRFGNFEVLPRPDGSPHLLGGGAFGKTYKARHLFLEQTVALKVIHEQFLHDWSIKERFLREARVVHGLRHPHIAHVMDFGEVGGTLYYAMEYCEGGSLDDFVRRHGPQAAAAVTRFARQLTEALGCAHGRGFIHRDVKPANVMLAAEGGPPMLKLVDFGLVKNLQPADGDGAASLTLDGQHFFTILFASPEQLEERTLDARSDLFSLGMTLWFLLKGSAPESGASATVVAKRLGAEPYRGQLPPSLPPGLRAVLGKLLEKNPDDRFQSATEVLAALDELERPPAATPPPDLTTDFPAATIIADADQTIADVPLPTPLPSPPPTSSPPPLPPSPPPPTPSGPPPIEREYHLLQNLGRGPLGTAYRVRRQADGEIVTLTLLSETLRTDPVRLADLRRNVARLHDAPHEAVARVFGFQEFAEGPVLVQEWTGGGISLVGVLRARGSVPFADALGALRPVAEGADFLQALDVPGAALGPDEIFLQPETSGEFPDPGRLTNTPLRGWPPFRVRLRPVLTVRGEAVATEDAAGATMVEEIALGNTRVEFAALLYQLVAGRRAPAAARVTRTAYTAISGLGEEGNRLLAACLCDEGGYDGCVGVLHALSRSEGVNEAAGPHSGGTLSGGRAVVPAASSTASHGSTGLRLSTPPLPPPVSVPMTVPAVTIAPPTRTPPPLSPAATGGVTSLLSPAAPPTHPAGTPSPGRPFPWLIVGLPALVVGLGIIGVIAFLFSRPPKPSPTDSSFSSSPSPSALSSPSLDPAAARPSASASAAPTAATAATAAEPTSPPAAREFVLLGGVRPASALFELNGRPVSPARNEGERLFIPLLDGGGQLKVSARGFEPRTLPVTPGGSLAAPLELARQKVRVPIFAERNRADYAAAVFTMTAALPGEEGEVRVEPDPVQVDLNSLPATADLPTGLYRVSLQGNAGGGAGGTAQPSSSFTLLNGLAARPGDVPSVLLPPSYAGSYQQEFTSRLDPTTTVVTTRVLVIEPGLGGGHVDDTYTPTTNGSVGQTQTLRAVPVANLRLDERGVLHGTIRFTQLGAKDASYDEQFEIGYSSQTKRFTIQGGDWEMEADDPSLAAQLRRKQGRGPHKGKPPPRPLARLQ